LGVKFVISVSRSSVYLPFRSLVVEFARERGPRREPYEERYGFAIINGCLFLYTNKSTTAPQGPAGRLVSVSSFLVFPETQAGRYEHFPGSGAIPLEAHPTRYFLHDVAQNSHGDNAGLFYLGRLPIGFFRAIWSGCLTSVAT